MIQLDIRTDIKQAQRFYSNLRKSAVRKAAARAINDVLVTLRADGARKIKQSHPALKISDIKNNMIVVKANRLVLKGMVETSGTPLSLTLFRPSGGQRAVSFRKTKTAGIYNATKAARARPVSALIGTKRSAMEVSGRKAFRIPGTNEIFVRRFGKGRQFRKLRGPSLPGVFRAQYGYFQSLARQKWATAFRSRMAYEIELAKRG